MPIIALTDRESVLSRDSRKIAQDAIQLADQLFLALAKEYSHGDKAQLDEILSRSHYRQDLERLASRLGYSCLRALLIELDEDAQDAADMWRGVYDVEDW